MAGVSGARYVLTYLRRIGADRLFIVSGTDYAAFIEEKARGGDLPEFVVVPHEITAASAAVGYALAGRTGAVAVHTIPGTMNALGIIADAYSMRLPLFVIAGRSPYTERGSTASRDLRIHWTQEARDQGGIVRQWVKLDLEIRDASQLPDAMARAYQFAMSEPRGPVYLMIPREVSVQEVREERYPVSDAFEPGPTSEALSRAQKAIEESESPVIVTWRAGRRRSWYQSLKSFADRVGIPVLNYYGEFVNYRGEMALDWLDLKQADLLIAVECEVPFIPRRTEFRGRLMRVDVDPLYSYIPYMGFGCDLCVQSSVSELFDRLNVREKGELKARVREMHAEQERRKMEEVESMKKRRRIHPRLLSYYVGRLGLPVINEYPLAPEYTGLDWGMYFSDPGFGHLGWALGAAFGFSLAAGKRSVAAVGDGAFIFGVPEAFYYAARTYGTDVTVVIFDNGGWMASAEAVESVFPNGAARARRTFPGADFRRYDIGATVRAFGGYYRLIERPEQIEEALSEAVKHRGISVVQAVVERAR
ncbi:MAG: thiamine pyrophosphate-requiring protein [Nitrososphaeria archaeon]